MRPGVVSQCNLNGDIAVSGQGVDCRKGFEK